MAAQNICFYSNGCDWSKAFIKELAQTPFKNQFTFICVDKDASGKRPNLPDWLKKVPTLVIKGEQDPIKTDAEVMNWLYMKKMMLSGPGGSGSGSGNGNKSGAGPAAALEPDAYMSHEMGNGIQDAYSFVDGTQEQFMTHSFEMMNGPGVRTGSDIPPGSGGQQGGQDTRKSAKADLFDKQMQDYMQSRNVGMPQARPRT
jgi:hypothetical protein